MKIFYPLTFLTLLLACFLSPAAASTRYPAPTGLTLPAEVAAGEGWTQRENLFVLSADTPGALTAEPWFSGNRPPRGQCVVLEVEYLDNLSAPVRAEIYSGLGSGEYYSELHRFGGLNDGRWKTARVPATSDFIFTHLPENKLRFQLVSEDGPLTARAFRLVPPEPDERERFNRESRQWVARVQQRADIDSSYWKLARPAVIPAAWSARALVPFARNWMDLVRPVSTPREGEAGAALTARMFLNECESVQVGVYANGRELKNVTVSAGLLTGPGGKAVAEVEVRVAEYSKVHGKLIKDYFVEPWPQRLWPAYAFEVPAGHSQLVWINVRTDETTAHPGTYSTTVRFEAAGVEPVEIPLSVEILDKRLLTMEEAGLKLGGCTRRLIPEFEMEWLTTYNHNMINIWYQSERPELTKEGNTFGMGWRIMDDWMASARRAGITDMVYFLGGNPYGFPKTMHLPRTLARTMLELSEEQWEELAWRDPCNVPPEVAPYVTEWSRRFAAHARANNWPNIIITPFDEPAKYHQYREGMGMLYFIKPQFKQQVALLRKGDPAAQIYGSIHHYYGGIDFLEDVDIFCTNAIHEHWELPDEVRAAGKTLWQYSFTDDSKAPGVPRYTFGYYFAAHGSVGSLVWAYNWGNRFDTLDGYNWMYVFTTPFEVVPMPFAEGLREAWDDRRLIETLKRAAGENGVDLSAFWEQFFAEVMDNRGAGGSSTLNDFWEQSKETAAMDRWRSRLTDKLLEVSER